ncbi:hypothetical protein MCOR05_011369, partial [Pyricularia oryzae]
AWRGDYCFQPTHKAIPPKLKGKKKKGGTPNHSRREEGSRLAGVCFFGLLRLWELGVRAWLGFRLPPPHMNAMLPRRAWTAESPGRCQVRPVVIPKPHMKDAARELRYSMRARSARVSY